MTQKCKLASKVPLSFDRNSQVRSSAEEAVRRRPISPPPIPAAGLSGAGVVGQVGLLTHSFVVVRMPKDYFEVEEVQEHVSEEDKQAKVINCANVCFL